MPEANKPKDDSAVLLIRVWREPGHASPFRARLTALSGSGEQTIWSVVAADGEQVLDQVRTWLSSLET